ncbi:MULTISPECIES: hypothetical protein [unclassified Bradyrhizobium]|uniref:hypothetical protein n=1 Tax=unclassified Bradyrhizobium TaxID=2631580 RepID=UPI001FF944E9|nr:MULTISPECIES: hypothetical protein [unclassified Bradyrhizobium]MCK1315738.1 hypothetical protein [Bradyrhizobium sp. 23]MCK1331834.1 hypothetical protein [Bradyrhizobium sp. CW9]MCK1505135.1 hypothetical protein [Bradyrhizobium sp. 18]MCK1631492.1 hypothetical protein [Bradyrhizobium sp. 162]
MKKNLLKIPQQVLNRINAFAADDVVVAVVKRINASDVGNYRALGVTLSGEQLTLPSPFIPPVEAGRYSRANVEGKEVTRKDLPMVTKTFSWESPNWGDWSNGSHTHYNTREVYQRDFIPPKEVELSLTLLEQREGPQFVVRFAVDQVLSKQAPDFDADLLYNLNILQENLGAADVFESTATLAQYLDTVRVDWEILPVGNVDEVVRRMLRGKRPVSEASRDTMKERLNIMARFRPTAFIAETNGFLRYFGAQFGDNLVAFENLSYGNALYLMYEDWEELSRRSRIDLLKGPRDGFDRIEHRDGWEQRLETLLDERR